MLIKDVIVDRHLYNYAKHSYENNYVTDIVIGLFLFKINFCTSKHP
jgi:hypothetical protein